MLVRRSTVDFRSCSLSLLLAGKFSWLIRKQKIGKVFNTKTQWENKPKLIFCKRKWEENCVKIKKDPYGILEKTLTQKQNRK